MRNKGFTLIEVLIVIVIIGVLASLALPKITGQIEGARAAEAMNMFGAIKRSAEQCFEMTQDAASCTTFAQLNITPPGANASFDYTVQNAGDVNTYTATRNAAPGDSICLQVDVNTGVMNYNVNPTTSVYFGTVNRTGMVAAAVGCPGGGGNM